MSPSLFTNARELSFSGGHFTAVQGDQIIHATNVVQAEKERTEYDEFHNVIRGDIYRLRDIGQYIYPRKWDNGKRDDFDEGRPRSDRMFCTAQVNGKQGAIFTVVSYHGPEAVEAFIRDFRRHSRTINATAPQLFGLNRSDIPSLIFYNELIPLANFIDQVDHLGRCFLYRLSTCRFHCSSNELWMDPARGVLCRGLEGPKCHAELFIDSYVEFVSCVSSAWFHEAVENGMWTAMDHAPPEIGFLQPAILFRLFTGFSNFKADSVIVWHCITRTYIEQGPVMATAQSMFSPTSSNNFIAVRSRGVWSLARGCCKGFQDQETTRWPDGSTRFTLPNRPNLVIKLNEKSNVNVHTWLSQASCIFHTHGVSLRDDLSAYKLIVQKFSFEGLFSMSKTKRRRRRSQLSGLFYLFLKPLSCIPLEASSETLPTFFYWSLDPSGQVNLSEDACKYFGLPTKLSLRSSTQERHSWPSYDYQTLDAWQVARGFDPTTTSFARYLGYPIAEVTLKRFE